MIHIDYRKIGAAQEFYEKRGFTILDAPWWATRDIVKLTFAEEPGFFLPHSNKYLVASAEQSFLYLAAKGLLPKGSHQATTPCFRYEPQGSLHRKCFIKTELIKTDDVSELVLEKMIAEAMEFFSKFLPASELSVEKTKAFKADINFDILCGGRELGSYGIRSCQFLDWVYGTGCAEPRLSAVEREVSQKNKV